MGKQSVNRFKLIRVGLHKTLEKTGLYSHLEWSPLHRAFIRINNPAYEASQREEMAFYRQFVAPGAVVFDVGANKGSKAEAFLRLGAQVIAVEPDPRCVRVLRRRFFLRRHFHLIPTALGDSIGRLELFSEQRGSAYNTLSSKWRDHSHKCSADSVMVDVSTVDALISAWGVPAFLKIDVEGFEREVLRGLNIAVPAVSFEANLPLFRNETLECIDRLYALDAGYWFNACKQISDGWLAPSWMTAMEMKELAMSSREYCEIFAFLRPPAIRRPN